MGKAKNRENEKGAAMVMVLLLSTLLLTASAGLLLEVTFNTANVTDSTAEQQAYNAAESGIQSAINVLRGNVLLASADRYDTGKSATDPANRIDFRKAVSAAQSNFASDPSAAARLSRWLSYDYASSNASYADRVRLGSDAFAFSLEIIDPDNTGNIASFNTTAMFYDPNDAVSPWKSSIAFGAGANTATVSFVAGAAVNLDVSSGAAATEFGRFRVTTTGAGASIPEDVRFQIIVGLTGPYMVTDVIRGYVKAGSVGPGANVSFDFDSRTLRFKGGSTVTLAADPLTVPAGITPTAIAGSITQAEPYRVVVRSTGYGPRGAKKVLEATVQKNFFNGMSAPATLTLIGSTDGFVFAAGSSQNVEYSGKDVVSNVTIPPIGTTNEANLRSVFGSLEGKSWKADVTGVPSDVTIEMPFWLQSPQNLHQTVSDLQTVAQSSGRYFPAGQTPPNIGNNANATGITFVDGDVSLSGDGGGILVCTGKLTLHGNFNFNGLIIVTGAGGVDRSGGGKGVLQGNIVIAPYNKNNLAAGFSGPKYDISGGGSSEITYNSSSVANGMTAVSNFVLGVAEK